MDASQAEPTLESKVLYRGRIVTLRVDTIRLPNGRQTTREIVEHAHCVCIVALDSDGNVVLVRQYRKPAEAPLLEVPAGGIDQGEDAVAAARRELQEETGLTASSLRRLSSFWMTPGWSTEYMHSYLATGLSPSPLAADDDENISTLRVPLARVSQMVLSGEIQDAKSIASLLVAIRVLDCQ